VGLSGQELKKSARMRGIHKQFLAYNLDILSHLLLGFLAAQPRGRLIS
jgi:hypothetical protein